MRQKLFKNLEEQMAILKEKGLIINDIDKTKEILLRENYFFISGYRHIFMRSTKEKIFLPGVTFEELYGFFVFDRALRNIFFKNILIIENNLKSILSYQLSKQYGIKERDYLKATNFSEDYKKSRQVNDVIYKMKRQIRSNGKQHRATLHYLSNYGYIPLWILVKVLSFGIISDLYAVLKTEDQVEIADLYKIDVDNLNIFLSLLANYRNLCAHEDILFDHRTQTTIIDNKYHLELKIPLMNDEYIYGKNDLFAIVIIFKYLLREPEFRQFAYEVDYELSILEGKIKSIPVSKILDRIGFPINWRDLINL